MFAFLCGRTAVLDGMAWLLEPIREHFRLAQESLPPEGKPEHAYLASPVTEGLRLWEEEGQLPTVSAALAKLDSLRRLMHILCSLLHTPANN